jgi:hypothetical protein
MDISQLILQLNNTCLDDTDTVQAYLRTIIESIKECAETGSHTLVYEIITLDDKDILQIRNELLTLFPDMDITIKDKRLLIDWS